MIVDLLILTALLIFVLGAAMKRDTVKAAIALALASSMLSVLMFRLASPLAAVFELSVCAGLITVVFMSTISLTKPLTVLEEERLHLRGRHFAVLPILVLAAAGLLVMVGIPTDLALPQAASAQDVRSVLWNERQLDLLGETLVILAGFFGILVLFKDKPTGVGRTGAAWLKAERFRKEKSDETTKVESNQPDPAIRV